jgi:hypothetical protein
MYSDHDQKTPFALYSNNEGGCLGILKTLSVGCLEPCIFWFAATSLMLIEENVDSLLHE